MQYYVCYFHMRSSTLVQSSNNTSTCIQLSELGLYAKKVCSKKKINLSNNTTED